MVKNTPARQEMWVQPLVQEEPLEKEMATHSSILAWKILWTEEPGGTHSRGYKESDMTEHTQTHTCVKQMASGNLLYSKRNSAQCSAPCFVSGGLVTKSYLTLFRLHGL